MYTVIESELFAKYVYDYWNEEELEQFIANNPNSGAVIPSSGGVRKLRWSAKNKGNRGGTRVIYFNRL